MVLFPGKVFVHLRCFRILLFLCLIVPVSFAVQPKACVAPEAISHRANKDVCVEVHVYDVVELPDGTRFLDVCRPDTPDKDCRFTIVSLWEDRREVGELKKYRDADVHVRGMVQAMHGRNGIVLSHVRQFYGGPPKFKPNPRLLHGFSGDQAKPPIADPNLRPQGGHRAFMNSREQEALPR